MGLSRDELGERLGVSGRTVTYWETWKKNPGKSRAEAIRKTLGLSELDLWRCMNPPVSRSVTPGLRRGAAIW